MLNALIVCCLLTQAEAPDLPKGTKVEYSKFVDATDLSLLLSKTGPDEKNWIAYTIDGHHKGRRPKAIDEVGLHITRIGPPLKCFDTHEVFLACGDERVKLLDTTRKYRQHPDDEGLYLEFFHIAIDAAEMQKALARGKDIEIKIGVHEPFLIEAKDRAKMLQFVKAVRSGAY